MKRRCFWPLNFALAFLLLISFSSFNKLSAEETGDVTYGNNLSRPVIWSDYVTKVLRGTPGMVPETNGAWWYWWGIDENGNPLSCAPDNDDINFCDDGIPGSVMGNEPGGRDRAYLQKDVNVWQAETIFPDGPVVVSWLNWSDSLEAVPWYLNSMVRVEIVLTKDLSRWMLSYVMRHTSGWGITEMWGLAVSGGSPQEILSNQATVYSNCARLTIQKLIDGCDPATLVWNETEWSGECVGEMIYSGAVREAGDGPEYCSAEINIQGNIIYGYIWNVRNNNAGTGKYRLTFSLDNESLCPELNTYFSSNLGTQIYLPVEETTEEVVVSEESGSVPSGGTAVILSDQSVSYIDIEILPSRGQGGNGKGEKKKNGGKKKSGKRK